jgi:hypothetical protein
MQEISKVNTKSLNQKWIKAAVLGTVWAASEIVLGSFLHNIRMPFSGNVLVGIAMILLISASHIWKEKGVIWRSGLICALLKTMSPSAIIFTPMIAIFTEGVLLELMVRLFRRKNIGYYIGAALAMSWNLFQKILIMIFFYSMNLVKVYEKIMKSAEKQLHLNFDLTWVPILVLLVVYIILGLVVAYFGIKVGKQLLDKNYHPEFTEFNSNGLSNFRKNTTNFDYSKLWLIANIILPILVFLIKDYISFYLWIALVVVLVGVWSIRYKRALKQVMKPKFWIWFVMITMLTSLLFSNFQEGENGINEGLKIGLMMNLRAILLIVSLTTIGTELYNPKIRKWLQNGRFRQLTLAIELSLESLPNVMVNMPSFKAIVKTPSIVFYQLIWQANERLKSIKQ